MTARASIRFAPPRLMTLATPPTVAAPDAATRPASLRTMLPSNVKSFCWRAISGLRESGRESRAKERERLRGQERVPATGGRAVERGRLAGGDCERRVGGERVDGVADLREDVHRVGRG